MTIPERRSAFRRLHERGCFALPNPWDVGTARMLEGLGFKALATTSSGHAWSMGIPDAGASRAIVLAHLRTMVAATDLPVNADFEDGYGANPADVAESVRMAIDTGVAGISIEDSTGNAADPIRTIEDGIARIRAARAAIDESGAEVMLIGRAENFFLGRPDLPDTLRRLRAYAEAGADCLYAPGIRTREEISAVVNAVAPRPVNVLIGFETDLSLADIAALGARRVSVGGALARAAWAGFLSAARAIADGRFAFENAPSGKELNTFFQKFRPEDAE